MNKIYKFRNWEDDYHKMMLKENIIHFASPNSFNDPFDSTIPFRYDLINKTELTKAYCRVIKHEQPELTRQTIRRKAREKIKKGFPTGEVYLENARKVTADYNTKMFGIFSLTKEYQHLLMWSHYANCHRGFCVEFNYDHLIHFCTNYFLNKGKLLEVRQVTYQEKYPILIPTIEDDIEYMVRPLTIKSKLWEYEKEHRLVVYEGAKENVKLPNGIITGIILGCNMPNDHKNEIKEIADTKKINVSQSRMHYEKYALIFDY